MRWTTRVVMSLAAALSLTNAGLAQNRECLEINGSFLGEGMPQGWGANKPGYWDEAGQVRLTPIAQLEMNALNLTSATRAMHLYCTRRFAVSEGDRLLLTAVMRGAGAGSLGLYFYPAGGWLKREFSVSDDWSEFSAEFGVTGSMEQVSVVLGIPPGASTEFAIVRARVIRRMQP